VQLIHRVVVEYEAETLSRAHSTANRKDKASETLSYMDRNYLPDQCYSITVTRAKTVIVRLAMQCIRACHDAILLSALRNRDKSHALLHCGYLSLTEISAYPLPRQLLELLRPTVLRAMSVTRVTTLAHGRAYTASNETDIRDSAGYSPVASTWADPWEASRAACPTLRRDGWAGAQCSWMHGVLILFGRTGYSGKRAHLCSPILTLSRRPA
jgi:hypothetical protein